MSKFSQTTATTLITALIGGIIGGTGIQFFGITQYLPAAERVVETKEVVKEILPETTVTQIADDLHNSVVSIVATKDVEYVTRDPFSAFGDPFFNDPFFERFFGGQLPQQQREPEKRTETKEVSAGTGFIISEDGWLLTNKHVVADTEAEYTAIFADGERLEAEILARDPTNDIAIAKLKEPTKHEFKAVTFIPQSEIKVGQMVVAIGNALGQFDNTVTFGVISATGRSIVASDQRGSSEQLKQLIQTDAAINPGNSGGPLVSLTGHVLGMNTAVAGNANGIGFAIPLDQQTVDRLVQQIKEHGKIIKPFLGVRYQLVTPGLNEELKLGTDKGAWLKGENDLPAIVADTPAAEAGLRGGDIILKVNGEDISEDMTLTDLVSKYLPNEVIMLTILRDGKEQELEVTLGEWSEEK